MKTKQLQKNWKGYLSFNNIYLSFIFIFIFISIILNMFNLVKLSYQIILGFILLLLIPLIPKIIRVKYKDLGIELATKEELDKIDKKGDVVISDEDVKKEEEEYSELDHLVQEILDLGEYNYQIGLSIMKVRLEQLVRDLFVQKIMKKKLKNRKPQFPGLYWNLRMMSKKLYNSKVIEEEAYFLLRDLLKIFNRAVHGFEISEENGEILYDNSIKLLVYIYRKNLEVNKNYSFFRK